MQTDFDNSSSGHGDQVILKYTSTPSSSPRPSLAQGPGQNNKKSAEWCRDYSVPSPGPRDGKVLEREAIRKHSTVNRRHVNYHKYSIGLYKHKHTLTVLRSSFHGAPTRHKLCKTTSKTCRHPSHSNLFHLGEECSKRFQTLPSKNPAAFRATFHAYPSSCQDSE